ncbi:MAG: ester cyclase [Pseudonocardia sp.]
MDVLTAVRTQFRALETGDPALAHAAVAPDWIDHEASFETGLGELRGPACLLAVGAWLRAGLPDLRFEEQATVADDQHVLAYCVLTGRHDGPFVRYRDGRAVAVIPPTGRRIAVKHAHVYELRDGLVVSHAAVRDDLGMFVQLGLMPPTPVTLGRSLRWRLSGQARRAIHEVGEAIRLAVESAAAAPPVDQRR